MSLSIAIETPLRIVRERRSSLPAPLTSFVGREKALAEVTALVPSARLVTLSGPGGSGKTRLCIEIARALEPSFTDGVAWVELAPVTDASLVAQTVASALGIRSQQGRSTTDAIADYLVARRLLLVLDNCEHVIDAVTELLATLLVDAPGVHILATSRERLRVHGERSWPVPPLGLPPRRARELDSLLDADAVRLFIDRAAMVLPAFAVDMQVARDIAEICLRVDGIPLAIELAAARMNVLSPRQIADRLADSMALLTGGPRTLPKRQRTLRATIDWSYQLLSEEERLLFRRLSVFAGTFSLDAAEYVCSDDRLTPAALLDLLSGLVDKSLVAVRERDGEARYRMLDSVDQFATEQLEVCDVGDDTLRRHAVHYLEIVETFAQRLRGAGRDAAMRVLDAEHDNIRAALEWTRVTPGCAAMHHRMIAPLWWYWLHRVLWDEGMQRYSAAVSITAQDVDADALARTLYGGGLLAWVSGAFLQSRVWLERCVELRRGGGDAGALGMALCGLAQPTLDLGDLDAALALLTEGMPLVRAHSDAWDRAIVLCTSYGYVHHVAGMWDAAAAAYREADAIWSEPVDAWGRSLALNSLAVAAWRRGDVEEAEHQARESLALLRHVGDRWFASRSLQVLGYIACERGNAARAAALVAASESLRGEVGARLMPFEVREWNRTRDAVHETLGAAAFEAAWSAAASIDFNAAIDLAFHDAPLTIEVVPSTAVSSPEPSAPPAARRSAAAPPSPAGADEAVQADLVICALGELAVRRDGRLLTNDDWTYAKPRELLFYLLSYPGGRTKEQIGLDLWPDATPARLRSSFHVTVHHLRRALGAAEWVAFQDGRYRFERVRSCTYDVEQFLAHLDSANAAVDEPSRISALCSAVQEYRGDFLDDSAFGDWTLEHRDRLRRRFLDGALELASAYIRAGGLAQAEETCRALLARDNLDERAHRLLIQVLADAGRPADALRHYAVVTALFREELGITPSAETAAIAERLRGGAISVPAV